jgi:hypothetical protein
MRQPRRPTTGARSPRPFLIAALSAGGLLAAVPASADASRYLPRSAASKITKRVALGYADGQALARRTSCWPTGRRHSRRNLRYRWRLWDCGWTMRVTHTDGSADSCSGKLRITGRRLGTKRRTLRAARCVQVTAPTPIATPAPTANSGDPQPATGNGARQQQMREAAVSYGIAYAQDLIDNGDIGGNGNGGAFYYAQINRPECVLLNATKIRCPMFLWWEGYDQDSNFYLHYTREIYRAFVFAEDLGTSVGFNTSIEPQGILSYDAGHPWRFLCSTWYSGLPACPANRAPIAYPPVGPPYPNPQ